MKSNRSSMWLSIIGMLFVMTLSGCPSATKAPPAANSSDSTNSTGVEAKGASSDSAALEAQVRQFCGACHAMPLPASFPKADWYHEVQRGYDFYFQSGRTDLQPPPQAAVTNYFRDLAPAHLKLSNPLVVDPEPVRFEAEEVFYEDNLQAEYPSISFIQAVQHGDRTWRFWTSDMKSGMVACVDSTGAPLWQQQTICTNPCAIRECDLDANGQSDLVITDLGSFLPEDHDRGQVVWWPDYLDQARDPVVILSGVGRVADVRVADMDNDGDSDLVVGAFGWHQTGGIYLLTNTAGETGPEFTAQTLDHRPGAIHTPVLDINDDGRLDIISLLSQEYETVEARLNRETGFEKIDLFAAPDPSFGSSGLEPVDLDQDGDLDFLYTNGDTFDSYLVKPYHGVRWLENQGGRVFKSHVLCPFPGVHRALPADLDGDGDLDIVCCALLPSSIREQHPADAFNSLLWLEQTATGTFTPHGIDRGTPQYAALTTGDFDNDGDQDFAVGTFADEKVAAPPAMKIYWNRGRVQLLENNAGR